MSSKGDLNKTLDLESRRRHTCAHVMSYAMGLLYGEPLKRGIGPWTDTGYYQDFDMEGKEISDKDFKKIEKKMRWIINKDFKIRRETPTEAEARKIFEFNEYKQELIDEIVGRGDELLFHNFVDENGNVLYYDLCAGGHVESTGQVGAFKLTKLAGAYWRGNSDNPMHTRIYGVAYETQEELDAYLHMMEEAAKRDHRKLGKELGLYTIDPEVGIGLPLWKPKGAFLVSKIRRWFEDEQLKRGYMPVFSPHIGRKKLWERSGHWGYYNDSMYAPIELGQTLADYQDNRKPDENETYLLKPMNCPFHVAIYNDDLHSYRDLPMRLYEFGTVYRYEQKGELGGLTRVRGFTQDDAHIICTKEQIQQEMEDMIDLGLFVLKETFGFEIAIAASFRDPESDKYLGSEADWDMAESAIREILERRGIEYKEELGEAAFYGPKMDFKVRDVIGREWQLSTIQFDFNLPERFDMTFINKAGEEERPLMVHRAMLGSLERFMGILIEHYAGAFPAWIAPVQVHVIPVNQAHEQYAQDLVQRIKKAGGRPEYYDATDSLGKRIRNAQTAKVPFSIIIGDKEMESGNLTVRKYGEQSDQSVSEEEFLKMLED